MFELDGKQYTLEEIQGLADKKGTTVEEFAQTVGLTKVEEGKTVDPPVEAKEGSKKDTASPSVDTSSVSVEDKKKLSYKERQKLVKDRDSSTGMTGKEMLADFDSYRSFTEEDNAIINEEIDFTPQTRTAITGYGMGATQEITSQPYKEELENAEALLKKGGKPYTRQDVERVATNIIKDSREVSIVQKKYKDYISELNDSDKEKLEFAKAEKLAAEEKQVVQNQMLINRISNNLRSSKDSNKLMSYITRLEAGEELTREEAEEAIALRDNHIKSQESLLKVFNENQKLLKQVRYDKADLEAIKKDYNYAMKNAELAGLSIIDMGKGLMKLNPNMQMAAYQTEQFTKKNYERIAKEYAPDMELGQIKDISDFAQFFGQEMSRQSGILLTASLTGGTAAPILIGASTAGQKKLELEGEKSDLSEANQWAASFAFGAAEGLFSIPSAQIVLKGAGALKGKGFNDALKVSYGKIIKRDGGEMLADTFIEAGAEGATQLTQNIVDKYGLGKNIDILDGVGTATVTGGMFGATFSSMPLMRGLVMRRFTDFDTHAEFNKAMQSVNRLNIELENAKTPEQAKVIEKEIKNKQAEADKIFYDKQSAIDNNLTKDGYEGLTKATQKLEEIKATAEFYINSKTIPDSEKQVKLKQLKQEFDVTQAGVEYFKKNNFDSTFEIQDKEVQDSYIEKAKARVNDPDNKKAVDKLARDTFYKDQLKKDWLNIKNQAKKVGVEVIRFQDTDAANKWFESKGLEKKDAFNGVFTKIDGKEYMLVNLEEAARTKKTATFTHEFGHALMAKSIGSTDVDVTETWDLIKKTFKGSVSKDYWNNVSNRLDNAKAKGGKLLQAEEGLTEFFEAVAGDRIDLDNIQVKGSVGYAINKLLGRETDLDDTIDIIKTFSKKLKAGEVSTADLQTERREIVKKAPSAEIKKEAKEKFSKDDLYTRTEKIYEEYGPEAGGFLIGEEYRNEIKRRLRKYSELQGFAEAEEDIIADAAYASNQSVRRLVETYKPDSGVPLNAWINKSLNAKILGAVQAAGLGGEFSAGEASEMKGLAAEDASDVAFDQNAAEAAAESVRREKFPNFIEAIKPDEDMVKSITNTLNRVIARTITSFNEKKGADASTTPWVNNMKKELAEELMPEIGAYIKEYGYEKFLIDYRTAILANYTTTFLSKHPIMRKSVLKKEKDSGKWVPPTKVVKGSSFKYEWVDENGKKLKIDRVKMKDSGKASGNELIKRNPDLDTLSENEFVDYHFDDGPLRNKAKQNPKKSLAMQIGSEMAFDILNKDLNEFGPISQRLKEVAELRDIVVVANFQEQITKDLDRGVVKFSNDNDATLIGDYLTDASNHNKVRSAINTFLRIPKSKSSIYSGAKEVFYNFDFVKDLEKIGVTDKGLEKLLKYFNSGRQQDYLTFGKLLLNKSNRTAKGTRGVSQEGYDAILSFPTEIVEDFITEIREKHKGKINGKTFKETNLFAYAVGNINLSPKQVKGLIEFGQSSKVSATDIDAFEKRYHKDLLGGHYLSSKFTEIMDGLYPVFAKAIANSNDLVTNITMLQNLLGSISINEKNLPNSLFFNTVVSPILDSYGIESKLKGDNKRFINGEYNPLFKNYKRKIKDLKSHIVKGDEKSIINSVKEINKTANENKDFLLKSIEYLSEVYNSDFINDQDKKTIEDVLIFSTKRESLIPNSTPIELVMRNDKLKSEKDYTWEHITRIKDVSDQIIKYIKGDKKSALNVINNYKSGIIPSVVADLKTDMENVKDLSISLSQTPLQAMGILVESNMPGTQIVNLTDDQIDQAKRVKESKDTVSYKHSFDTDLGLQWRYYDGAPFRVGYAEGNSLEADFEIDGEKYKVIVGHNSQEGSMGVSFVTIDEYGESFAATKRGRQFTILGGVANATQDLANKLNVTEVEFTGTGDSRVRAYSALAKMLAKKHGWMLTEEITPSQGWTSAFDPDDYTDGDFLEWMDMPGNRQRLIDDGVLIEQQHIRIRLERDERSALDAYNEELSKSIDNFDQKYSMDTKVDLDWKKNNFNDHEAIFELDKETYKIISYNEGDSMVLGFYHKKDGEWHTNMTNFGNPFKVLSAVSNGALKFAAEKGINKINFAGSGSSRIRAYKTLAKMFAAKGGFDIEIENYRLFSDEPGGTMDVVEVYATRNQSPAKYSLDTKLPLDAKLLTQRIVHGDESTYRVMGSVNGTTWMDHHMFFEHGGNEYEISLRRYAGSVNVDFYQYYEAIEDERGEYLWENRAGKFRPFIGEGPLPEGFKRTGIKTKTTNDTGSGSPFKILSIVSNAALDFADKYGLFEIEFTGYGKSRVKAYNALAKMLEKQSKGDWSVVMDISEDSEDISVKAKHIDRMRAFDGEYDTKFSMDSSTKVDWKSMDKDQIKDYPYYMQSVLAKGVIADFEIDGNEYLMKIMPEFGTMRDVNFAFSQVLDDGTETLNKTGTGNAFKVFGTVGNALVDYMNSKPGQMVDSIHFTGEGESRAKLYVRLGKMLAKRLGWKVHMDYEPTFVKVVVHHPAVNPTEIDLGLQDIELDDYIDMRYSQDRAIFDLNEMIERKSGIKIDESLSDVRAKRLGKKEKGTFFVPYSNEDFMGFMYMLAGKGKQGEADLKRIKELFVKPFSRAEVRIASERKQIALKFAELKERMKESGLKLKDLRKESKVKGFTKDMAVRVYIWNQQMEDINIPGLNDSDVTALTREVINDPQLLEAAKQLMKMTEDVGGYPKPSTYWDTGNVARDLTENLGDTRRKYHLAEWQSNVDAVFTKDFYNKLTATFGEDYVKYLKESIAAMKRGKNRIPGSSRVTEKYMDFLNGAVGSVMFWNQKTAVLQQLSNMNFLNWSDNNIFKAGQKFANQPEYWKTFIELFNSDYLVNRRDGLKINVSESELAEVAESSNPFRALAQKLIKGGFTPTRWADSFAIATGGATFYLNRIDTYVKEGMSEAEAKEQAFIDFTELAEENQQSSRTDKISHQQRSPMGRFILAFANTPIQYARITKKSFQDLINNRGNRTENISKILYYGALQNIIFSALQQGMFALLFDDEDDEEGVKRKTNSRGKKGYNNERELSRAAKALNGTSDSLLRGLGVYGATAAMIKNVLLNIYERSGRRQANYRDAALEVLSISPPLDSKITKLRQAGSVFDYEMDEIKEAGFSMDNPAALAAARITSVITNVGIDRVFLINKQIENLMDDNLHTWQRVFSIAGYQPYELGIDENAQKKRKKREKMKAEGKEPGKIDFSKVKFDFKNKKSLFK